jgi:hypothetical protein
VTVVGISGFPSGSSSYGHAMYALCALIELLHATLN